jgi:diguanylate cyclase (GGDEF)-like protein
MRALQKDSAGLESNFTLVSPYPWTGRPNPEWTDFRRQAWRGFAANPDQVFWEEYTQNGKRQLRVAIAQTMSSQSCVECHNADMASTKRDWKPGDLAGVIEVNKSIEPGLAVAEAHAGTIVSFVVAAGVFSTILIVLLNISSVRRAKERGEARKRIEYLAYYDTLTGALNRGHFLGQLAEWLQSPEARAQGVAIHFVDLDKFKEVNDTLGHDVGDDLVRQATARLLSLAGKNDLVGRVGGDEFVVAQRRVSNRRQAEERAAAIVKALAEPFIIRENRISISASVGVVDRLVANSANEMLKCADLALYRAKALGRNQYVIFNQHIEDERAAKLHLEQLVRDAIASQAFKLYFQPICDAATGEIQGFETLIRMFDPEGQLVPTQTFIATAEAMGAITQIDEWVLRHACEAAASWPRHVTIAVNLSPANFGSAQITGRHLRPIVARVLAETGLDAHRLELEITEGILLENTDDVLAELRSLKELGVSISLDDFGAGYSSLNYLWKFPFDKLKIDGSFVRAAEGGEQSIPSILRAIATLGRDLGLKVCAEGVETTEQRSLLVSLGAHQIQGYLYGRPTPMDDVPALLMRDYSERVAVPALASYGTPPARRAPAPHVPAQLGAAGPAAPTAPPSEASPPRRARPGLDEIRASLRKVSSG